MLLVIKDYLKLLSSKEALENKIVSDAATVARLPPAAEAQLPYRTAHTLHENAGEKRLLMYFGS